MSKSVEFYFDFGSPDAYFCLRALPAIEARIGKVFVLKPVLLAGVFKATNNRSPVDALAAIPARLAHERAEMKCLVEPHGLMDFRPNPFFPINTSRLMHGAYAAKNLDIFDAYIEIVTAGMWEKQLDMGNLTVFATALHQAGLPAAEIYRESQTPEVKQTLIDVTQELVDRGGFGIPAFYVGKQMLFGKDCLREVEESFAGQAA